MENLPLVSKLGQEEFEDSKGVIKSPYIEEEQTLQWPKEKVQRGKQRSTKHTHWTNDRVTWTPLRTRGKLRCSGRVISYIRRVNLATNPVKWGEKAGSVVSFTSSSMQYINGIRLTTFGLFIDKTVAIYLIARLKALGTDHLTWRRRLWFFSKKIFWFPMLLKKIFWFW